MNDHFTAATYNVSCDQFSNGRSTSTQNYRQQNHSFLTFQRDELSDLAFIGPCILIYSYSKTNQMHQILKLFLYNTLHVSDDLSVHHQEFRTVHTATGICQTAAATCTLAGTRWNCISISFPLAAGSNSCLTYACCCMYSPELLMMDGKTVRNIESVMQNEQIWETGAFGWFTIEIFNAYRGLFPQEQNGRNMRLATHLHFVQMLRKGGAIFPLPLYPFVFCRGTILHLSPLPLSIIFN
jgi:hypothetical protein